MNRLYVVTFILAWLASGPAPSALAAQAGLSEKDQVAIMANAIEGMKKNLKQLDSVYTRYVI